MKYIVIGAGISGLSVARMLQERGEDVVVFEASGRPGGMVKCDRVNGSLFHRTGGHVFNTKREDVLDWFWKHFDKDKEFTKALRNSVVCMEDGKMIPYPIENHAYMFSEPVVNAFIDDLLTMAEAQKYKPKNFEEFLRSRFGETLYNLYFEPYNKKVWRRDLSDVPLSWLEGKLPMPTVKEIIYNNINHVEERAFVHSSFFYPVNGGSQFLADRIAQGLNIIYDAKIERISKTASNKWRVNGCESDRVIFCGNVKQIPALLDNSVSLDGYVKAIEELEYHGTTAVFCEMAPNPYSWIYQPSRWHESHRIICTGNFAGSNNTQGKMTGTIEFTDEISKEDILSNLKHIPGNPQYLTHHYEQYTYPIQKDNTREMMSSLKSGLESHNIFLLGRFAEWEYYNMDVAMGAAMDFVNDNL